MVSVWTRQLLSTPPKSAAPCRVHRPSAREPAQPDDGTLLVEGGAPGGGGPSDRRAAGQAEPGEGRGGVAEVVTGGWPLMGGPWPGQAIVYASRGPVMTGPGVPRRRPGERRRWVGRGSPPGFGPAAAPPRAAGLLDHAAQRAAGTPSPSRASALRANTMASCSGPSCASSITRNAARGSQHG